VSAEAPTPSGPQIGADEWVSRSGERILGPKGPFGAAVRAVDAIPPLVLLGIFVALVAAIPFLTSNGYVQGVATDTMLYILLAVGLNVAVGWAGLLDLGYVAFYGFAAYIFAALSGGHLFTGGLLLTDWPTWAAVVVAIAATVFLGFVLALPTRRLRGDYLAIVTLFFLEIFNNFTNNGDRWDWLGLGGTHDITGGTTGIIDVHPWKVGGTQLTNYSRDYMWVALGGFTVLCIALMYANRSRTGRAWRALREDPLAAELMGMPVKWLTLLAVAVGAGVAGFAGTVVAAYHQQVSPDGFTFVLLITIYAMVILGGAGSMGGVIVGAIIVNVLLEVLNRPDHARWVFYVALLAGILVKVRPWKRLVAVLGGLVAFGVIVNQIVGAVWPRGVHGPIAVGPTTFSTHGFLATALRHWLVLPANTYTIPHYTIGNYAFVILLGLVLALTLVKGWVRWVLLVPTIWLAAFVWENLLIEQAPTVRPLLLGVILIVLMTTRPAGLFGEQRVEIV
jgi:branched-chain amino acid transport system permease protein